ncbi:MAG: hypothetical protein KKI02_02625, partial [Planctomycetes bacterium]|nr:hypothetical protein [Planctomycetota bacterium]
LVLQESTISMAPEFVPPTPYIGFFEVKINDQGDLVVMASVDDPNIPSTVDRALVWWDLDNGVLVSESVIMKEGDVPAGQTEPVYDMGTGPHQLAFSNYGDALYFVDLDGDTTTDGVIFLNTIKIAQEGDVAPDPTRTYGSLSSKGLDLNDFGGHVFKAQLDSSDTSNDYVLIRDGTIFRREGESIPAIAPDAFAGTSPFGTGSGPVQIDHCGNVFYFGDWNDPNTDVDSGLFLNDQLIVQEGVTVVGGSPMDTINSGQDAFALSDNGRYAIFEATLLDGTNGAFTIEFSRCADFDGSGTVDLPDLAYLLSQYGICIGDFVYFDCQCDLNFDGCINLPDLAILLSLYGGPC